MATFTVDYWVRTFGIFGNILSLLVYLAPAPTYYRIYKKKSTEGFQSVPYVVALSSAMLWIFYACVKTASMFIITINSVGCIIETVYIAMYIYYASKRAKIFTATLLCLTLGLFCLILLLTLFLSDESNRVHILGWVCMVFSVSVFAAPLSILGLVIRTKSVEFMPLPLSIFLTLSAVMWYAYGQLQKDYFVAVPNVFGFLFGATQMVLYMVYKGDKEVTTQEALPEHVNNVVRLSTKNTSEVHPVLDQDENPQGKAEHNEKSMENQTGVQHLQCEV